MSADAVTNPIPLTTESNTARKKRERAAAAAAKDTSERAVSTHSEQLEDPVPTTNGESNNDSPYIKDLQK